MTWADVRRELDRLATLTDGWDGEGGPAPHPKAIEGARRTVDMIDWDKRLVPGRVHVSVNGSIIMEWFYPGLYQEMEISYDPRRGVVVETKEVQR
jgi:hypothetical protein